jgi:hypothetical protein
VGWRVTGWCLIWALEGVECDGIRKAGDCDGGDLKWVPDMTPLSLSTR